MEKMKGKKGEEGGKKIAPSLSSPFFSFLFSSSRWSNALLFLLFDPPPRPFVVPVLPFVSPARNETPCLWLNVTQWASRRSNRV